MVKSVHVKIDESVKSVGVIGSRSLPFTVASQVGDIVQDLLGRHYHIATGGAVGADQFVIEKLLRLGVSERCTVYSPWQNYASLKIMVVICFGGRYPLKMSLTSLKLVSIFTIKKAAAKRLTLVVFPHECRLPEIDYVKWVQLKCGVRNEVTEPKNADRLGRDSEGAERLNDRDEAGRLGPTQCWANEDCWDFGALSNTQQRIPTHDRQAKEGDSLEEQESELKKFCDYRNFKIHRILIERGKSGGNTNRPEYKKLVADIEEQKINAVVVKKLDRLSRSLLDFEHLMTSLQEKEVEFISLRENFDTTTAMGKAMLRIALVFAQLEREQTSERLRDVFSFRASQGQFNGGIRPYGYTTVNKELIPSLKEKQVIEIMMTKFLEMKSTTEVARYLNETGHRTRSGKQWGKRKIH